MTAYTRAHQFHAVVGLEKFGGENGEVLVELGEHGRGRVFALGDGVEREKLETPRPGTIETSIDKEEQELKRERKRVSLSN